MSTFAIRHYDGMLLGYVRAISAQAARVIAEKRWGTTSIYVRHACNIR